jgi:serine/threonine protein kinase
VRRNRESSEPTAADEAAVAPTVATIAPVPAMTMPSMSPSFTERMDSSSLRDAKTIANPSIVPSMPRLLGSVVDSGPSLAPHQLTETGLDTVEDEEPKLAEGQRLMGHYVVVRALGRGGMGTVYLARDERTEQLVAVKALPASLARERDIRERFVFEAKALAALDHENIVPLIAFANEGDDRLLVMKYIDGESLADRIHRLGVLSVAEAERTIRAMLAGLDHAHRRGIIHRDVKPSNVITDQQDRVFMVDFGIAKRTGLMVETPSQGTQNGARNDKLTRTGMLMGTPQYMSPEQIGGATIDGRGDLYACGLCLFEMLAGAPPFDGDKTFDIMRAQVERAPPDVQLARRHAQPGEAPLPERITDLLERLLRKDPRQRPQSGAEALSILDGALPRSSTKATPSTPVTGAYDGAFFGTQRSQPPAALVDRAPQTMGEFADDSRRSNTPAALAVLAMAVVVVGLIAWMLNGQNAATPNPALVPLARAEQALQSSQFDDARKQAEVALRLDPSSYRARFARAAALVGLQQAADAKPLLAALSVELEQGSDDEPAQRLDRLNALQELQRQVAAVEAAQATQQAAALARLAADEPKPAPPATKRIRAITDAEINRVTQRGAPALRACYVDQVQGSDQQAQGVLAVSIVVLPTGRVESVDIKRNDLSKFASFGACATKAIRSWRFPAFKGDSFLFAYEARLTPG